MKASEKKRNTTRRSITLGELVSAAYEVSGSAQAVATLLSPFSPLARRLDRRIVVAGA
jgi:glycine cleavage system regulatory protein